MSEGVAAYQLASRWQRLWASLVDGLISLIPGIPLAIYFGLYDHLRMGLPIPLERMIVASAVGFCIFLLIHGYLLATHGQTIGKKALGIKIVNVDDRKAGFAQIAFFRYLPMTFLSVLPFVGNIFSTLDGLFIFRKDKRCLHDLIASTRVVRVAS